MCVYIYIVTAWRSVTPGFSTRQVEGLQGTYLTGFSLSSFVCKSQFWDPEPGDFKAIWEG
ncbi:unnamed protein product [Staurois parvus]|uniref:Uncharacterized protein n=1 Tax=Staurois parvus TaxID=386267 RepID=A0ABN9DAV1_9NEOB|nr:unnamed protein product [Staurois parvus]